MKLNRLLIVAVGLIVCGYGLIGCGDSSYNAPAAPEPDIVVGPAPEVPTVPEEEPVSTAEYWVSTTGDDLNPGTQENPFRTLVKAAAVAYAQPKNIKVMPGTYREVESVYLRDGVSIHGMSAETSDPDAFKTVIDFSTCADERCGIIVSSSSTGVATTIDYLTIIGKGRGIMVTNASPTITNCDISTVGGTGLEFGISINASGEGTSIAPVIRNNAINAGPAMGTDGMSIGVMFYSTSHGTAMDMTIEDNDITSGDAPNLSYGISGTSPTIGSDLRVRIADNDVRTGSSNGMSYAIALSGTGVAKPNSATIERNIIAASAATGTDASRHSTGLAVSYFSGPVTIANNFVYGGSGGAWSDGISMNECTEVRLYYNSIDAGFGLVTTTGIYLAGDTYADLKNNIVCGEGVGSLGIDARSAAVDFLKNNLFCTSLEILYVEEVGGIPTLYTDTAVINGLGGYSISDNLEGNPKFRAPLAQDYHITTGSDAIDAGIDIEGIMLDVDGNNRDKLSGPDIGAHEYP